MTNTVPVQTTSLIASGPRPVPVEMPVGLTIREIVGRVLPELPPEQWAELRVTLTTPRGTVSVEMALWHRVRPRAGVRTLIRVVPRGDNNILRNVLIAVVSVAAMALGAFLAPIIVPAGGAIATLVQGAITTGVTVAGSLLIKALVPPTVTKTGTREVASESYAINGWQNELRPNAAIPFVAGRIRFAPPFAARPYTEIKGDQQYVRALFCIGYGPVKISDIRIGETPISEFDDVDIQIREGRPGDAAITLVNKQIIETGESLEVLPPQSDNPDADPDEGASYYMVPLVRLTASNVTEANAIFSFSAGLFRVDDEGEIKSHTVQVLVRYRLAGTSTWHTVTTLKFKAKKREAIWRQHRWSFPTRGKYEVEFTRLTSGATDTKVSDRVHLVTLQSIRPERPINFNTNLALLAIRVRATHQLNGALDRVSVLAERYAPVWDGETWSEGLSRSPASAYLAALQGAANAFPVPEAGIDLDQIAAFSEFCEAKGLKYDRVHEGDETLGEALQAIASAGRASPQHDGVHWNVVTDRPLDIVSDHLSPRNTSGFSWTRSYFEPPDGFRVSFLDETNDYKLSERVIPWPGASGSVDLTEALDLPGKTDPDEVWREARRRMYELIHRPDDFTVGREGIGHPVMRGDQVLVSTDLLSTVQAAARVLRVSGALVVIDDVVTMAGGKEYGLRWMSPADEIGAGNSVLRQVVTEAGPTDALQLIEPDILPDPGTLVHFGPLEEVSYSLRVRAVEPGEDASTVYRLVASAPEIDALTDAEEPPVWDGSVGLEGDPVVLVLSPPVIDAIEDGLLSTGDPDGLTVLFTAGDGPVRTSSVRIEHRLSSAGAYDNLTVPSGDGGADIPGYTAGDTVAVRLVGIASDGTESGPSAVKIVTIGADDPSTPLPLTSSSIAVSGGLGHATVTFGTGADDALAKVQIYRVPSGAVLDRNTHAIGAPVAVTSGTTITVTDGDATRSNIAFNGSFNDLSNWTTGAGWSIAAGVATHAPGAPGDIEQTTSLTAGINYRGSVLVTGVTAGTLAPMMQGGADVTADPISASGVALFDLAAVSGNTSFGFAASSAFDGAIDDVVLIVATPSCAPAGAWDYYLEPLNEAGGAGPISAAFAATII